MTRNESDSTHLSALELRLSHERARLAQAKTRSERALRSVWIAQIEREIAHELGRQSTPAAKLGAKLDAMSDAELLAELSA